jgi:hypothetical protein
LVIPRRKILGILVCILLIGTLLPTTGILTKTVIGKSKILEKNSLISNDNDIGTRGIWRSLISIPSPDGNNYSCMMYCNDHTQTLEWISLVDQLGFEKAWQQQIKKLTILLILPGTIILFGLDDFLLWYSELFLLKRHKVEFLDFLNNYDELNGSGMITYTWKSGLTNKASDFKSQPDNSWIKNSWILDDNGDFIPNPEIWKKFAPIIEK